MSKGLVGLNDLLPIPIALAASLVIYNQQALLLFLKVGEVFSGVFDTSVPAFPLAGMLFVLIFIAFRRAEFSRLLASRRRSNAIVATGIAMAALPMPALLVFGAQLSGSYVYAAFALVTCWVGVMVALRPAVFRFLLLYLVLYLATVGSVGALTSAFGDPLALVVAWISSGITTVFGLPVEWSSVYITFVAAGGSIVNLYISQECSGIASVSIFLLLVGLMHMDLKPRRVTTVLMAAVGSVLFVFLNAFRIVVMIAGGIYGGVDLMWNLHGWVGYVFYVIGYAAILLAIPGSLTTQGRHPSIIEGRPPLQTVTA
ncbi:MAG: exosortase/archaeosortase family protein [Nitrososphaerota archaeon]|nr:exosortase/archaeosortase family protein [Nitrososphaerota archaeon]